MPKIVTRRAALTAIGAFAACGAAAGPASDRLFVEDVFRDAPTGAAILYDHQRRGVTGDEALRPITDGEIEIKIAAADQGGREAILEMRADGRRRGLNPYPAEFGNPLLTTFLESSLRSMARITGGSPFYIRNRMKDALRNGGAVGAASARLNGEEVTADEIVFHPFKNDKNRVRMGAFGALELRFLMAEEAPGGFLLLSASTGGDADNVVFEEIVTFREIRRDG